MITDYQEYVDRLNLLRKEYLKNKDKLVKNEFDKEKNKLISLIRLEIVNELSKYLKKVDLKISKFNDYFYVDDSEYDVFLIDSDYGIKVKFSENTLGNILANFNTIRKNDKYFFVNGKLRDTYKVNDGSVKEFVEKYINKFKIQNKVRIINKMKKVMKKYNL